MKRRLIGGFMYALFDEHIRFNADESLAQQRFWLGYESNVIPDPEVDPWAFEGWTHGFLWKTKWEPALDSIAMKDVSFFRRIGRQLAVFLAFIF